MKDPGLFVASEPGVNVYLVDIDEQACILDECDHFPEENNYVDFSSAICEVPGTSIGVVSEGRAGWGEGKVCLVFTNSEFSFDREDLPEAFIFYGTHRDDFFLRAAFSRVFKVPAIFIDEGAIDMSVFLNRKIYIDTPTNVVVKL
ncbi:hypothetical protein D3C85_852200 [compost metagenome]